MKWIFIISILIFPTGIFAQKSDSLKYSALSVKYAYGIIYAHYDDFKYFIEDYVQAIELNYGFRSRGDKIWQQIYHYPERGIGYTYINLGNPDVLGRAHALFTYVNIPLVEKRNCLFSSKFAAGVAYLTNPFDLYENKYNIAIGSHINAYLNINFDFKIRIYENINLLSGIGLTHFSNGGTTKPNKGINIFLPSIGLSYDFQKQAFQKIKTPIPEFTKNYELSFIYSVGYSSIEPANPDKYFASDLSLNFKRRFSYKGRFGIGLDCFYDTSLKDYIPGSMDTPDSTVFKDLLSAGGHISYDFIFGNLAFTVQMGAYFYKGQAFEEYVYHRFGLKYYFAEHWMANLTLRTFWAKAKYPEFGIAYRIKW